MAGLPFAVAALSVWLMSADAVPADATEPGTPAATADAPVAAGQGIGRFPRRLAEDEWRIWRSPFRRQGYNSRTVKKYVVPFTLIAGALIASDRKTQDVLPNTPDQMKWSGRVSQLGASYTLGGLTGTAFALGHWTKDDHLRETGLLGLEALGHTQLVVFVFKQATNRERPLAGDRDGSFWEGGNSFPSGHAASAFAVATVFAYEYRYRLAVPIVAYTLASAVSVSRLSARRHWISDIFVGGSTGFLLGRYIYKRHHDSRLPGSPVRPAARLLPEIGAANGGVTLAWRW